MLIAHLMEVMEAVRSSNNEVGARLVEWSGAEYMVRARGYVKNIADLEQIQRLLPIAHDDARLLMERDGGLDSERGQAARILLYLFERDWGVQLLRGAVARDRARGEPAGNVQPGHDGRLPVTFGAVAIPVRHEALCRKAGQLVQSVQILEGGGEGAVAAAHQEGVADASRCRANQFVRQFLGDVARLRRAWPA